MVWRLSLSPFRHEVGALFPAQSGPFCQARPPGTQLTCHHRVPTPPRLNFAVELLGPLEKKYEYIGLRSRPLIGVISGARMRAQSSPRNWNGLTPRNEFVGGCVPVVCCRPTSISSTATYVPTSLRFFEIVVTRLTPAKSPLA